MADLPKVRKDADDLTKPEPRPSWRKTLVSALTAVAASVALGSVSVPPAQAAPSPAMGPASLTTPTGPAKLIFHPNLPNMQSADHYSHSSHYSHESHSSHVSHHSHYSGFQG